MNDDVVAAWAKEQNRGVPSWGSLDEASKNWWRTRYAICNQPGPAQ